MSHDSNDNPFKEVDPQYRRREASDVGPSREREPGSRAGGGSSRERTFHDEEDIPKESGFRRIISDSIAGLLDSSATGPLKRGQEVVSEVAHGTKEEVVRRVSTEVKGFLEKVDIADIVQQALEGLVVELKTEIRFKRREDGEVSPSIKTERPSVRTESTDKEQDEGEEEDVDYSMFRSVEDEDIR